MPAVPDDIDKPPEGSRILMYYIVSWKKNHPLFAQKNRFLFTFVQLANISIRFGLPIPHSSRQKGHHSMFRMKNTTIHGVKEINKVSGHFGTYFVLSLSLGAMVFFGMCSPRMQTGHQIEGHAASVSREEISRSEFSRAYSRQTERLRNQYGENFNAAALKVANTVMNQLVDERVLYLKANDLGLRASDEEVVDNLNRGKAFRDKEGKFSEEAFKNYLRYNYYSEASFMDEIRRDLTSDKLRQFVMGLTYTSKQEVEMDYRLSETKYKVAFVKLDPAEMPVTVTPAESAEFLKKEDSADKIKNYFEAHKSDYNTEEKVQARHILITYEGARSVGEEGQKRTKAAAQQQAKDVLAKVKAPGADFAALAKQYTDEAHGKETGGDLGSFTRDAMVKEFSDAAFSLKVGTVSDVVETPFGFHIIRAEAHTQKEEKTLAQVQASIVEKLIQKYKGPAQAKIESDKVQQAMVKGAPTEELLKPLKAKWEESSEFSAVSRYIPKLGSDAALLGAVLTLTKEKPYPEQVLSSKGVYFVLKLVEKKEPDLAALTEEKRKQLATTAQFSKGYRNYSDYSTVSRKEFEDRKAVSINPHFLALDTAPAEG